MQGMSSTKFWSAVEILLLFDRTKKINIFRQLTNRKARKRVISNKRTPFIQLNPFAQVCQLTTQRLYSPLVTEFCSTFPLSPLLILVVALRGNGIF